MTFDDAHSEADQEIDLVPDPNGCVAYPVKLVTHKISIFL